MIAISWKSDITGKHTVNTTKFETTYFIYQHVKDFQDVSISISPINSLHVYRKLTDLGIPEFVIKEKGLL